MGYTGPLTLTPFRPKEDVYPYRLVGCRSSLLGELRVVHRFGGCTGHNAIIKEVRFLIDTSVDVTEVSDGRTAGGGSLSRKNTLLV